MKKLFFSILIVLISQCSYAGARLNPPSELKMNIDFSYQSKLDQAKIQNSIIMPTHKPEWTVLGSSYGHNKTTDSSSHVEHVYKTFILLAKLEKADAEKVAIRFLIVDLNSKSSVISEPKIIVNYGQKGKLSFEKNNHKIQLIVLVNKDTQSI